MKTLYLDCSSGISGDMTVAALLDLGAGEDTLRAGLASMGLTGYALKISRVHKSGIDACDFDVQLDQNAGGAFIARNINDAKALITASAMSANAKDMACRIFDIVAEAEAAVHNLPLEEVYFHESGAVDSIVDIAGTAICMDSLGVDAVMCSPLYDGTGTVETRFGPLPVPVPATLEIARRHAIPLVITGHAGEMVTPTGAAIAAGLSGRFGSPDDMGAVVLRRVGYGAGKRDYKTAGVLRAMILEHSGAQAPPVLKIECNIDDMTGEELAYACEKLLDAGALDVWLTPIFMKKGRPAHMLSVLCAPEKEDEMTKLLFFHSTTIGVRLSTHRRNVMARTAKTVETEFGPVLVKESRYGEICKSKPEFEEVKKMADQKNLSVAQISRSTYNGTNKK
ncbi:MAG: nickel pincer cofactor biosynthesis protein LarC [Oscillospiraceae bacterium]|jgi:uncharacterized protein (TIGR00299 family) protein|nr:nickel pincer cofactor biosynthesis protein LarC [Oscillospiraceae bacterium]